MNAHNACRTFTTSAPTLPIRRSSSPRCRFAPRLETRSTSPQTALEQKRGYPDIAPLRLAASPADAFERAATAVRSMGWDLVAVAPGELRIEATDTSRLFGFKDDVVVRVGPSGTGSVVDVRSLSRVGGSDFGVNAKRVRALLRKIGERAPS